MLNTNVKEEVIKEIKERVNQGSIRSMIDETGDTVWLVGRREDPFMEDPINEYEMIEYIEMFLEIMKARG